MNLFIYIAFTTRIEGCKNDSLNKSVQYKVYFKEFLLSKKSIKKFLREKSIYTLPYTLNTIYMKFQNRGLSHVKTVTERRSTKIN